MGSAPSNSMVRKSLVSGWISVRPSVGGNSIPVRVSPRAAAVRPAAPRSWAARMSATLLAARFPSPTSNNVPTMILIMLCRNALARTRRMITAPLRKSWMDSTLLRIEPCPLLSVAQKDVKSWAPRICWVASTMESTSSDRDCHSIRSLMKLAGISLFQIR